jgi:hypothetical protein
MADAPSVDKDENGLPKAEELKLQSATAVKTPEASGAGLVTQAATPRRRGTYRPSHKATFIGVGVVIGILAINAGIIAFVLNSQSKSKSNSGIASVSISQSSLDKLGVNQTAVGNKGIELTVNPDAKFNGKLQVGGDVTLAGQLKLNAKLSGGDSSFSKLEAGDTALSTLNVNGDGTLTNVNVRSGLNVAGESKLQGAATFSSLVTVYSNLNVSGNVAIGGQLAINALHVSTLITDSSITLGGHFITSGSRPSVSAGSVGSNGTVSISGNDAAGTVAVNVGVGGASGILAYVSFRTNYSNTPHVVITPIGSGAGSVYVNRSASGFSIGVNGSLTAGGYAFDYIVEQ